MTNTNTQEASKNASFRRQQKCLLHESLCDKIALQVEPVEGVKKPDAGVKQEVAQKAVKKEVKEESSGKPVFTVDIGSMTCTMHSVSEATEQTVPLQAGPKNLLIGKFGEVVHTTELCNLMMHAAPKQVKKRPSAKRPAAAPPAEVPVVDVAAAPADEAPADVKNDYHIMHYGTGGRKNIGIKEKYGAKKQVVYFGGKACTKTKQELTEIAKVIVKDLHEGMSADDAKEKGQNLADAD